MGGRCGGWWGIRPNVVVRRTVAPRQISTNTVQASTVLHIYIHLYKHKMLKPGVHVCVRASVLGINQVSSDCLNWELSGN